MRRRTLTVTAVTAVLVSGCAMAEVSAASQSPLRAQARQPVSAESNALAKRPDRADWEETRRLRGCGTSDLHRTAPHRPFQGTRRVSGSERALHHPPARAWPVPTGGEIPVRQPPRLGERTAGRELDALTPVRRHGTVDPRVRPTLG